MPVLLIIIALPEARAGRRMRVLQGKPVLPELAAAQAVAPATTAAEELVISAKLATTVRQEAQARLPAEPLIFTALQGRHRAQP